MVEKIQMPKPKSTAAYTGPMHPVGTRVSLQRPSLWAGESGVVESCGGRIHIIRVRRPNQTGFLVAAPFEELKVDTKEVPNVTGVPQPSSEK